MLNARAETALHPILLTPHINNNIFMLASYQMPNRLWSFVFLVLCNINMFRICHVLMRQPLDVVGHGCTE